jgi:pyridoxamine 5'-phosphate oxidase
VSSFAAPLHARELDPDPLRQFERWFREAGEASVAAPEAAAVASAAAGGAPSVRMVLVKRFDARGFVFFTNYESRKARELTENPRAALLFHWEILGRQVRIEGPVSRTSPEETAAYVRSRPRASQLSALASPQSRPVASRADLEELVARVRDLYAEQELPLPAQWGGFRVAPEAYEFWQHQPDRLHDRFRYLRDAGGSWRMERLGP